MRLKLLSCLTANHTLCLVVAGSFCMDANNAIQAAEKKTYTKPPFAAFASQMSDPLLGSDKYEKPVWNLHDTLNLPKWLSLLVEQRTRYETMDGMFKAGGNGGDQQIPLQTDVFLEARYKPLHAGVEFLDARPATRTDGALGFQQQPEFRDRLCPFVQRHFRQGDRQCAG